MVPFEHFKQNEEPPGERWVLQDSLHSSNMAAWNIHLILIGDSWLLLKWWVIFWWWLVCWGCLKIRGKESGFELVARDPLVVIWFLWDIKSLGIDFLVMQKFSRMPGFFIHSSQRHGGFFPRATAPFMSCIGSFPPWHMEGQRALFAASRMGSSR